LGAGFIFIRRWPAMRVSARELVAAQGMMPQAAPPPEPSAPPS